MIAEAASKVTSSQLRREAYLYVRQSTLRQVFENQESTKRQYALRERAIALGWPAERIVVIDSDLGHSGAFTADRPGFQRLVADVGMGRVGLVMGLEVSRLARSSVDWARLIEICALAETLILDEDGIYDPGNFNDRLLLGLKGTMSEAELHFLRARMRGGLLNKARRGELKTRLPVGLVYAPDGRVILDPDQQVRETIALFFATFRRTGSAMATVRAFREQGILLPFRMHGGPHHGELHWVPLVHSRALELLHNPRYAGAFVYGQQCFHKAADGRTRVETRAREDWIAFFPEAHPGYISWSEYEDNRRRLHENAQAQGAERRKSPPREGPALLQGLVICGRCGERMTVHYEHRRGVQVPNYVCQREGIEHAHRICQFITGASVDAAVGQLLVQAVTPLALEVSLGVQQELQARAAELDRLRRQQVERARYGAEMAQRRYMAVDPNNRLVAATLESDWNTALRELHEAQEEYERRRQAHSLVLSEQQKQEILALARDIPRLWKDPATSDRDRKRLLRLVIEDVTLQRDEGDVAVNVRFRGGAVQMLTLPLPLPAWRRRQTPPKIVQEIDRLLDQHHTGEVAALLNAQGLLSGGGQPFTIQMVDYVVTTYGLATRLQRLRRQGLLMPQELADRLGVKVTTIHVWHRRGLLQGHKLKARGDWLFEVPDPELPAKGKHKRIAHGARPAAEPATVAAGDARPEPSAAPTRNPLTTGPVII
jgi:DNA invertase Pin-like site-specific DNA recombinase